MAKTTRNTFQINATVDGLFGELISKARQEKINEDTPRYASQASIVEIALDRFFYQKNIDERDDKLSILYYEMLKTETGKSILNILPKERNTQIEKLRKKGVLCVELGQLDEALDSFEKAKELEEESRLINKNEKAKLKDRIIF